MLGIERKSCQTSVLRVVGGESHTSVRAGSLLQLLHRGEEPRQQLVVVGKIVGGGRGVEARHDLELGGITDALARSGLGVGLVGRHDKKVFREGGGTDDRRVGHLLLQFAVRGVRRQPGDVDGVRGVLITDVEHDLAVVAANPRRGVGRVVQHAAPEPKHKVQRRLLLDVVVKESPAVLELPAGKDEALLILRDPLLVADS
mmetsp:Transcript_32977/g.99786  ORF Transcript_32977/g.99786 Transcript_32977/m.99786 type:complete len:201 (+) Transcript_32977:394-996(+)